MLILALALNHVTFCVLTAGSPRWPLTGWPAWLASTSRGTRALAGASSSTTWLRTQMKASFGRCSGRLVLSQTSRLSATLTQTSAKDLVLSPWRITTRQLWPSPAWMDTALGTEFCKCHSKPTKHTKPETQIVSRKLTRKWKQKMEAYWP